LDYSKDVRGKNSGKAREPFKVIRVALWIFIDLEFETRKLMTLLAGVAQSVEQVICNH
jgi:hypothetical protein